MWFLGKRARREKALREGELIILPPKDGEIPTRYVSIPEADIPKLAEDYVSAMETQRTNDWCRCGWKPIPEDMDKPKGKRRMMRTQEASDCPVHTKEGFLIYFFDWMLRND